MKYKLILILQIFSIVLYSCKNNKSGDNSSSKTAEDQCNDAADYTWHEGKCVLEKELEKDKELKACAESGPNFIWINDECMEKKSVQTARERCESKGDGSYWHVDNVTGEESCIGPVKILNAAEECVLKQDQGYLYQDGRCLSPKGQKCKQGGDVFTDQGECITLDHKACIDRYDGSVWESKRCVSKPELECRDKGIHFKWVSESCIAKTFVDYCRETVKFPDIGHTINVLKTFIPIESERNDCALAEQYLNTIRNIDLSDRAIISLLPLTGMTDLEILNLQNNKVEDLNPIQGLILLRELNLADNNIENIDVVRDFTHLELLSVTGNNIQSLAPLSKLKNLKFLYAEKNYIKTLADFIIEEDFMQGGLNKIELIDLSSNCTLSDADPLKILPNLGHLDLGKTSVTKLPKFLNPKIIIDHSNCTN